MRVFFVGCFFSGLPNQNNKTDPPGNASNHPNDGPGQNVPAHQEKSPNQNEKQNDRVNDPFLGTDN